MLNVRHSEEQLIKSGMATTTSISQHFPGSPCPADDKEKEMSIRILIGKEIIVYKNAKKKTHTKTKD